MIHNRNRIDSQINQNRPHAILENGSNTYVVDNNAITQPIISISKQNKNDHEFAIVPTRSQF
jgi:hypothetical protein